MWENKALETFKAKIEVDFYDLVCMSKNREKSKEKDSYSLKVILNSFCPDCFLVADELGYSIIQKRGRHAGVTRLLCEKISVPKQIISNQDKHFSLLGFSALTR